VASQPNAASSQIPVQDILCRESFVTFPTPNIIPQATALERLTRIHLKFDFPEEERKKNIGSRSFNITSGTYWLWLLFWVIRRRTILAGDGLQSKEI
jgi:hypothetical protein